MLNNLKEKVEIKFFFWLLNAKLDNIKTYIYSKVLKTFFITNSKIIIIISGLKSHKAFKKNGIPY